MLTQTVIDYEWIPHSYSPVKSLPFGQSLAPKPLIFYIVESHQRPVNVLDIGFGAGGLGKMIRQNSSSVHWAVDGVDAFLPNCLNQQLIAEKVYRNLWHGDVRMVGSDFLSKYDVICLLDVIEHLDDPRRALRECRSHIMTGGWIFLSTPDTGSLVARAMGRRWHYQDPVQHINLLSRRNLDRLLLESGFRAVEHITLVEPTG